MLKPYQQIPIQDCGEALVPIPLEAFAIVEPHPYASLGAPYADRSPFYLRQSVLTKLHQAQKYLQTLKPGWQIQIFDAYRPVTVQRFMVDYTFADELQKRGWAPDTLSPEQTAAIWEQVHQFWAVPSDDPATPPPHSTGAAIDVTLVDAQNQPVDMGSPIDEISPRSYPDHFADQGSAEAQAFHGHRTLLQQSMESAGFLRHHREWWHFSWGDQVWAWLKTEGNQQNTALKQPAVQQPAVQQPAVQQPVVIVARYGRV
jgi:zinc D-Ala-D-Ala dipeptidase